MDLERYQEAAESFDQYFQNGGPPHAAVYLHRGRARAQLEAFAGALDDYNRALALQSDPTTLVSRGWMYLITDAYSLAIRDFDEALRLNAENAEAYNGRGLARVKLGQNPKQAVADAQKALQYGNNSARSLCNSARIFAGAAGLVDADPRPSRQTQQQRTQYQEQAVSLIRKALYDAIKTRSQRAEFWQRYVQPDSALKPIRGTPEFIRWTTEFGSAKAK